jgi:hypothetical protein
MDPSLPHSDTKHGVKEGSRAHKKGGGVIFGKLNLHRYEKSLYG